MPTWILHAEFFTLIGTMIGGCLLLISRMDTMRKENHDMIQQQAQRIDEQGKRSDRLYEMFIELLKDNKKEKK